MGIIEAYQLGYDSLYNSSVIGYVHDDLICHEDGWQERVLEEFTDPYVAIVGFFGATGHGQPHMYQQPFHIPNMVRIDARSNLINAEQHGRRLTGSMNAAVLDGMALFVRNTFLTEIQGWIHPSPISYFMYTEWLCCMARRMGRKIRVVGVSVEHLGGRSSGVNPNLNLDYEAEHRYVYEEFRDVLPSKVNP